MTEDGTRREGVVVVGAGSVAAALAGGLGGLGIDVATTSGASGDALASAAALLGGGGAGVGAGVGAGAVGVVLAEEFPAAATNRLLVDVEPDAWDAGCEAVLRSTIGALQAAHALLVPTGGAIVVVVPTITLSGAAGFAPYLAATEGQRGLVKSAARQWGRAGIRVNCVALPPWSFDGDLGLLDRHRLGFLPPRSLPATDDVAADVAPVVRFLLGDGAHHLSGLTMAVDGGVWMAA